MLKFTRQGKFLLQIGRNGQSKGNTDTANLNRAAEAEVDLAANEVYVADGYGNRRVIVFDADTGAYKRHWGAYGKKPDDTDPGPYDPAAPMPQVFRTVHCAQIANDGLVYVCDRANDRIQVFRKDGTFVKEAQIAKNTLGDGVVFDIAFSRDTPQRHAFVADGANHRVWTILRDSLQVVSHFGNGGRYPGQFYAVHNVSLDSKGNIYTVETYEGKRLQKFNYKGIGAVSDELRLFWRCSSAQRCRRSRPETADSHVAAAKTLAASSPTALVNLCNPPQARGTASARAGQPAGRTAAARSTRSDRPGRASR